MALFAMAYLLPSGRRYVAATRAELAALLGPLGVPAPGGQDSMYYALIDVLQVVTARRGGPYAAWLSANVRPEDVPLRLARQHGVIVLPGQIFDSESWDVRVSLASLTVDELVTVGEALVTVLDDIAAGAP